MSKALIGLLGLAAIGGLVYISKAPTKELKTLQAVKAQDGAAVLELAGQFDPMTRTAHMAIAQVFPTQEDVLGGFAAALSFAVPMTVEWIKAYHDIGRHDIANQLSNLEMSQRPVRQFPNE